jgi:Tfp pilus assembly protein PilF
VAEAGLAETRARLGIARQRDRLCDAAAATEQLRTVIAAAPRAPYGAIAQAHLQLAHTLDRSGTRDEAIVEYRAAIAAAPADDPLQIASRARAAMRSTTPRCRT